MADDSDILTQATEDYKKAKDAWSEIYQKAKDDLRFLSDEPFAQWDASEANARVKIGRPALTIDQLGQFVHQVTNDIRMNTPTINVVPDGDGSDVETADIFKGLIKAIEYASKADAAYDTATDFSVKSSIGFIRVDHDYVASDGFEQELIIKRVINPQSVFIDPDSTEPDGSDAKFGFVLEEMSQKEFKKLYPKCSPVSFGDDNPSKAINDQEKIVIAEYFKIEETYVTKGLKASGEMEDLANDDEETIKGYKSTRKVASRKVLRYKLAGQDELEKTTFPGIYIPIVPVYGEEAWEEGKRKLNSLIRKSKEAQGMYNLWKSLETELLLKQQQAPVMAAVGQMRGFEDDWKIPDKAMVLAYHQTDAAGDKAPPPQRLPAPQIPTGIVNAARETVDDIKATMGMYNASIGQRSNETSGIAINSRKKEGDVATFHFGDNLVRSITHVGVICVYAIPEVYDTARIIKIVGQEDEVKLVGINGQMAPDQERAFDLTQGKYDVRVQTGPPFTTQREEAAAMYTQLITAMPDLMPVIGDLVFKYQDTAGAQAVSARLKKLVDPKLLSPEEKDETQPDPQIVALTQQLQQVTQEASSKIQQLEAELQNKQGDLQIKAAEVQVKGKEVEVKGMEAQAKVIQAQQQPSVQDNSADIAIQMRKQDLAEYQAQEDTRLRELSLMLDSEKIKLDMVKLQMTAQPMVQSAEGGESGVDDGVEAAQREQQNLILAGIMERVDQLTQAISQPIQVIRDENNNIIGAQQMFQGIAFQRIAFQTNGNIANDNLLGGKDYSYFTPYQKQREKIRKERTELQKLDSVLKETERKKQLAALSLQTAKEQKKKQAAIRLLKLENDLLEEINRLLAVRAELMRRIREDEAILVIMMMKRRRLRVA